MWLCSYSLFLFKRSQIIILPCLQVSKYATKLVTADRKCCSNTHATRSWKILISKHYMHRIFSCKLLYNTTWIYNHSLAGLLRHFRAKLGFGVQCASTLHIVCSHRRLKQLIPAAVLKLFTSMFHPIKFSWELRVSEAKKMQLVIQLLFLFKSSQINTVACL